MAIGISRYISPIPTNLVRSSGTLARLSQLDSIIVESEVDRGTVVFDYIRRVSAVQKACLSDQAGACLLDLVDGFDENFDGSITRLYQIREEMSADQVDVCIKRMVKDSLSLVSAPLKKSMNTLEGPTFLISYPRKGAVKAYVVKWTDWNELCSTYVYEQFSTYFGDPKKGIGFLPPSMVGLDLRGGISLGSDRNLRELSREEGAQLSENFKAVLKGEKSQKSQVMVADRILGENLLDFAKSKYDLLNQEQKIKLFERLGRLAFFDLLMGNTDRLVRVENVGRPEYTLFPIEANLGNVMLVWQPESEDELHVGVYAIDNGIRSDLLKDPVKQELYAKFLKQLFKDPSMVEQLVENVIECSLSALESSLDDEEDPRKVRQQLEGFRRDLKEIAKNPFANGIQQMVDILKRDLLPLWKSGKADSLKTHITQIDSAYLSSLEERFAIFESSME